jgi:DNA-binding SARP family transcriptional activator/tetratricopeptide (TPR) repeat protein
MLNHLVHVRVLGPVEAVVDDQLADIGPAKRRLLLALLAFECGHNVSVDRLIELTWEHPPPAARRVIYAHVARLRKVLGGPSGAGPLLTTPPGYTLRVAPETVDAHQFRRLVDASRKVAEPGARADMLRAALELWRGPLLAGLHPAPGTAGLVHGMHELRMTAVEDRIDADLDAGRHGTLLTELAELAAANPLRERMTGQLMLALYRCGRVAEALDLYRRTRAYLADEFGIDPGPALRDLHSAVLRQDTVLDLPVPAVAVARSRSREPVTVGAAGPAVAAAAHAVATTMAPAQLPPTVPAQLPPAAAGFVGRAAELDWLDAAAGDPDRMPPGAPVVICAIAGTGGVGKTTLAVQWAHRVAGRFPAGQLYVNLRGFDPTGQAMTPAEAVRGFLNALGVTAQRIPATIDAQTAMYRTLMAGRRILVLLDNARDADQVRPLLPGAPTALVVVTSRNRLSSLVAVEGARALSLDLLPTDAAQDLLAHRLGPDRLAAEPEAVDNIITSCARLPLALAIVAARAAGHSGFLLRAIASELHDTRDRLDALTGEDPATDIRAVFSWSYRVLSPAAARLFRLLGVHPGPDISAAAAASLIGQPLRELRALLDELGRAHLIVEHVPGRYTLHDLLRVYAHQLAHTHDPHDQRRQAVHRMLDHYLHTAHHAARVLHPARKPITLVPSQSGTTPEHPADYPQALAWFVAEHAVLLAAVTHAAATGFDIHTWQLAWSLYGFLDLRGHWHDQAATAHAATAAAARLGDLPAQADAYRPLAHAYDRLGRTDDALTQLGHALILYRRAEDPVGQAYTYRGLAYAWGRQGRHAEALDAAQQALDLFRAADNRTGQAAALNMVGMSHARLGDHRQAVTACQQALHLYQELGDRFGQALARDSLGQAHHHLGHLAEALVSYQHALDLHGDVGNRYYQADTLSHLGDTHHAAGSPESARTAWEQALTILDQLNHPDAALVRARIDQITADPSTQHDTPELLQPAPTDCVGDR